jgi:hypothetical protein
LQPRHTVSVRARTSSSSSCSIRFRLFPIIRQGVPRFAIDLSVRFALCVALSVVPRWARFYPCFFENCPRARSGCSSIQRFKRPARRREQRLSKNSMD